MLSLTRKTDYALVALAALAEAAAEGGDPMSASSVARHYTLPRPQMMNVFKDLQRAGLVRSVRGARGGYVLVGEPESVGLIDVIEAIEGQVCMTPCCDDEPGDKPCVSCGVIDRCPVTAGTRRLNEVIVAFLTRITLRDLMDSNIDVPLDSIGAAVLRGPAGEVPQRERT